MDFDESVRALDALAGEPVEAEIWGVADGAPVARLSGELRHHVSYFDPDEQDATLRDALESAEICEVFVIGDAQFDLWPSRFIDGEPMPNTRGWLEFRTKDAVLRIGPKRRPWID